MVTNHRTVAACWLPTSSITSLPSTPEAATIVKKPGAPRWSTRSLATRAGCRTGRSRAASRHHREDGGGPDRVGEIARDPGRVPQQAQQVEDPQHRVGADVQSEQPARKDREAVLPGGDGDDAGRHDHAEPGRREPGEV